MADEHPGSQQIELPVLDEVIRPGRPHQGEAPAPADGSDRRLRTEIAAIIERHAREAIEEITLLLDEQRDRLD